VDKAQIWAVVPQGEKNCIMESQFLSEDFAQHFRSIFISSLPVDILGDWSATFSDLLNVSSISHADVKRTIPVSSRIKSEVQNCLLEYTVV
jgi:hypothetical protein